MVYAILSFALLFILVIVLATVPPSPQPAKQAAARAFNIYQLVAFTVGAKVSTTINVACQLKDAKGKNVAQIAQVFAYLSDNSDGSTLTATATTSALAIGTNGVLLDIPTTGKVMDVITNSLGQFDINIIQTASPQAYYLVICTPDGGIAVSSVIQF